MKKNLSTTTMTMIPGIVICFVVTILGMVIADYIDVILVALDVLPDGGVSPISWILITILIGTIIRNTTGLRSIFKKGVAFYVKYALRIGIILLGLRLSLLEALKLGAWGLPLIVTCIASGLF